MDTRGGLVWQLILGFIYNNTMCASSYDSEMQNHSNVLGLITSRLWSGIPTLQGSS